MSHIPVEILHLIFIQLDLKDKLECMLVCRSWYNTLDQRSLFHTLCISYRQFQRFKNIVERLSDRGTQVDKLVINVNSDFDKRKLCNMFPNLRELYLKNGSLESIWDQNYLSTKFDFIYPTTKLVRIEDFGHCELVRQLAMSNLVRHVNFLSLNLSYLSEATVNNILSQLKNMPVLETLLLSRFKVKLMHLEILHSNLGFIKHLDLCHLRLCTGEIPQNVTPATLITKMEYLIEYSDDLHTHIQFYKYMYKKYPSVSHPERYDVALRDVHEYYVREVYTKGIIPLYQDIGSQMDTFCFESYCECIDAFRKFDEYGFKLTDFRIMLPYYDYDDDVLFLEELVQSNQAKYIQHLHLQEVIPLPLIKLKHMETLHTLRIDCGGWRRDSDYYRKKTINFICSDLPLNPTCINYLELTSVDLTWDLAKIIETIFPKLSTLILQGNLNNNLEISLPNRNLEKVSIITVVTEVLWHGFVIKTTNDGTLQYHAPRKVPDSFRYDGIPVMKEEFNALFVLTLALL